MIQVKAHDQSTIMIKRLQKSQSSGFIQLDNLNLAVFPTEAINIQEMRFDTQKWWDIVPITKADLSNNKITEVPEEINTLSELTYFRMQNNHLQKLPESLFLINTLKSVDVVNNQLQSIPMSFIRCSSLVEANFRQNRIETLPVHYGGLWNLEILDLSANNIRAFQFAEGDLPRLKKLDLSQNQIDRLEVNFASLKDLEYLNLSKNKISKVSPGAFENMQNIKYLDLKENKLVSFEEFPNSSKLDTLILAFNQLRSLQNIQNSQQLTVLDLKSNKLEYLDPNVSMLKELKTLDISNNDLKDVPNEIGFMNKLVRISLEGNPLKSIRSSIRSAGTEAMKKYLRERTDTTQSTSETVQEFTKVKTGDVWDQYIKDFLQNGRDLIVNGQKLTMIHDKFCALNLNLLDLSNNQIQEINPNLARLNKLQKLRLNSNQISFIDGRILSQLEHLEELELRNNKLTSLLDDVFPSMGVYVLQELKYLDLSQNKLAKVPNFTPSLQKLRTLVLAYNVLQNVDVLFKGELSSLETLDLSNNKLDNIGDEICILTKLQHLNCENNNIANFPVTLGQMPQLKNLMIYGNPIKNIRRDIVSKGAKHILEYLQSRVPVSSEPVSNKIQEEVPKQSMPQQQFDSGRQQHYENEFQQYSKQMMNQRQQQGQQQYYGNDPRQMMNQNHQGQQQYYGQDPRRMMSQQQGSNSNDRMIIENTPPQFENRPYQPERYAEESKSGYEQQQNLSQGGEIKNEIKALDATIAQLENELQENFTLSTGQIMKKKKEINALRSRKNILVQQLR